MFQLEHQFFFLPLRKFNSIKEIKQETVAPAFFRSSQAARAVPPVAKRSSTTIIFFS